MTGPDAAVLDRALARGGQWAEVYRERTRATAVVVEEGRVEQAAQTVHEGAGVRIRDRGCTRFAHTTAPDEQALRKLASRLAGTGTGGNTAVALGPARTAAARVLEPFLGRPVADRVALCREADRAARAADPRIRQVRVVYRDHVREIRIATSDGRQVREDRVGFYFAVLAVAGDDRGVQTGYEAVGGAGGWELLREDPPEAVATRAARRAARMLDARPAPAGAMPVVLAAEAGGTMIHEAVGHGLEADLVLDGHSVYAGRIGDRIAGDRITVVDDPTLPGRRGSYAFDDEGTPAQRTVLVDGGILRGFLHSRETADRMGARPTGNGRRESYRDVPLPRMSNTFIAPGTDDPDDILRATPNGLYVTRMGGGQVNTVSGDFVFEVAEGFRIENGRKGEPVRGATLVGNGPRVLATIDRVGSDLGFGIGTCGKDGQGVPVADAQPTLRIPELVVGGRDG